MVISVGRVDVVVVTRARIRDGRGLALRTVNSFGLLGGRRQLETRCGVILREHKRGTSLRAL